MYAILFTLATFQSSKFKRESKMCAKTNNENQRKNQKKVRNKTREKNMCEVEDDDQ